MSPNEQTIASGRAAMSIARSIIATGVTQTGHPGPCTSSTSGGSTWSMPWRISVWVWPPQTSMSVHGRVTVAAICVEQRAGDVVVAVLVEVLHAMSSGRTPSRCCGRSMNSRLSISASRA